MCKSVLAFDRTVLSVVKCPKCAFKGNVADYKESTSKTINKEPALETELNPLTGKLYKPGKLELVESDAQWLQKETSINLSCGINTIGRMSPNSAATVQVPIADTFMSRIHATIEVVKKTDDVFEHLLSDNGSINGTFHNGERLEKGDVIKLLTNDNIKIGHTILKLVVE